MNQAKCIGIDVSSSNDLGCRHGFRWQADRESILETKATTILQFIGGLGGSLLVTFEEGTSAAWLYDLLRSLTHSQML